MDLYVLDLECPVCRLGPLGVHMTRTGLYVRCVECASYWPIGTTPRYDNWMSLPDDDKTTMRPATLAEIEASGHRGLVNSTWSHPGGFRDL